MLYCQETIRQHPVFIICCYNVRMNNQSKDPWRTLVLSGCILATYVPLRSERSENVSEMVIHSCMIEIEFCIFAFSQFPIHFLMAW